MNLALDNTNDLYLTASQLSVLSDEDSLAQRIKTNLATYRAEFWLNRQLGVPYFENVLGKRPDMELIKSIFRSQILSVSGVLSVDSLEAVLDSSSRTITITFTATGTLSETAQGEITI